MSAELTPDLWLAQIIGKPCYRLRWADGAALPAIPSGSFVTAITGEDESERVRALQVAGFRRVDTNITLERGGALESAETTVTVRPAAPVDKDAVRELARSVFRYSRFHQDPAIGQAVADEVKARWAENYFSGKRGQAMLLAIVEGRPVGFLQLLNPAVGQWVIDLIGVHSSQQGKGVAKSLIRYALATLPGLETMVVGTQIANTPSLALYKSLGFQVRSATHVYHCHKP